MDKTLNDLDTLQDNLLTNNDKINTETNDMADLTSAEAAPTDVKNDNNNNPSHEVKSIEINLNVLKTFFLNTISLYELLIKNLCKQCNLIESDEFICLHKNLIEFENIFKLFDISFDQTLLTTLVKKNVIRDSQPVEPQELPQQEFNDENDNEEIDFNATTATTHITSKYPCYVSSCSQFYSSEEGSKVHFIKSHCKKGDMFERSSAGNTDDEDENNELLTYIFVNEARQDSTNRFICPYDDCNYSTTDRSNFRVHLLRHNSEKKFECICGKRFFTRDPFMIHFVRVHMRDVDWSLAQSDIRTLRKTVRRLTNRNTYELRNNDDIPDSDSDLNGPIDEEKTELNTYIMKAIEGCSNTNHAMDSDLNDLSNIMEDAIDDTSTVVVTNADNQTTMNSNCADSENSADNPQNSFSVSLNLKDNYFVDSVMFCNEGVEQDLLEKLPANEKLVRNVSLKTTKDKIVKKRIPQRQRKYKCPHKYCGQEFFTSKNLLIHLKASHDPDNPVPCNEPGCEARFKSVALLAQHQKRHQVQYSCSVCPYRTHLAALMTRHNRQHAGEHLYHECSECNEKFEYLGSLRTHMTKIHHQVEPLKCSFEGCDKRFKTIVGYKKHCREAHFNMKSEFACEWPDCTAVFSTRTAVINHQRRHTNERPFQCTWHDCGKWFRLKETLKRHLKLHQGYKPHICPFDKCEWSFMTKKRLKIHIEKGHLQNETTIDKLSTPKEIFDSIMTKEEYDDEISDALMAQQSIEMD